MVAKKGDVGEKGSDGLTTSVTVDGIKYNHNNGNITLPPYPTLSSLNGAPSSHVNSTNGHPNATTSASGFMSSADKTKLDGIATGANKYVHPSTHAPSIIAQDSSNRFVTDAEKSTWNAKETTSGSQAKADKAKADAISSANSYTDEKVAQFVDSAPETLDTLNELAKALGNDPNFATTIATQIGTKADTTYVDTELSKKANASHGTHVTYSTTAPKANGTATAGSASTVARTDHVHPLQTTVSGNAGTATKLATARIISATGDVTGSVSFDGSSDASLSLSLANSGVTAGSYGATANATASHGGTISIPQVTVDAKGRVTSASTRTITLPADSNTDTKVTNTLATTTKAYVTGTTSASTNTGTQVFDTGVYLDTTAGQLTATTFKGALSGNASSATKLATARTINGVSFDGSANITITANPNSHTHASTQITGLGTASTKNTGTASGNIPVLGSDGKLPTAVLPSISVNNTHTVETVDNALSLTCNVGDVVIITAYVQPTNLEEFDLSEGTQRALNSGSNTFICVNKDATTFDEKFKVLMSSSDSVTHAEFTYSLNNKVDKVSGKQLSTNDYTTTEKNKLAGIESNANNYSHPSTHDASMITQSASYRFVTDTEKSTWNGKANASHTHNYAGSSSAGGSANSAVKATQDSAGQQINTTYIKGLSVSGKTITYTKGDGTTGTITTQDTNTTYSTGTASSSGLTKLYTETGTATDGTMTQSAINTALSGKANSSHTHGLLHDNFTVELANTTTDSGWSMINSDYTGYLLKSLRTNASAPAWILGSYSAGIAFGGSDTKGVMSMAYNSPSVRFAGGNGTKPVWYFTLTGTSDKSYNMDSLDANTANTLATARTINGTSFNGSANITTANWGTARTITIGKTGKSVNGSGNVSWSLAEIGCQAHKVTNDDGTCITITDANAVTTTGMWKGSSITNSPITGAVFLTSRVYDANNQHQTLTPVSDSSIVYARHNVECTWSACKLVGVDVFSS